MKKLTTLFALFAVAGVALAGIEVLGIEVLGIEVLSDGTQMVETHSTLAPAGSVVLAVMDQGAGPMVVNMAPVDPNTGNATVAFPFALCNNRVELRDANGSLLCVELADGCEFD